MSNMKKIGEPWLIAWKNLDVNLKFFFIGILFLGVNNGILNSTFNNYLYDIFHVSASERGFIEFPREFPGFALIFVTALLTSFAIKNWAVLVGISAALGIFGLAYLSPTLSLMLVWMILWSLGDHLFLTVESVIGLQLAKKSKEGKRLGQVMGLRNLSIILGSGLVFILIGQVKWSYSQIYILACCTALLASWSFSHLKLDDGGIKKRRFVLKKKYTLFYIMNILFGARKQLFLTFSPWLLVSVFKTTADTIALLVLIASLLGFVFRQYFGILVDKYGERLVLTLDAIILVIICLVFAFSKNVYLLYAFFIVDSLMFATRIARTTYLHKTVELKEDFTPTVSMGVSMDHAVSMLGPIIGGLVWDRFGYSWVFLLATFIAILTFFVSLLVPKKDQLELLRVN